MRPTDKAVLAGCLGSLLLCLAAWLASPWGLGFAGRNNPLPIRWAHSVPTVIGIALLFVGWLGIGHFHQRRLWRTFAWWCTPLMMCPPLLSKDVWAYLEQGWIVLQGHNPYLTALSTIGGPFADRVDQYWQFTTTVYPPLALQVQAVMVWVSGADPFWSMMAMRIPGLITVLVVGFCLPRIARRTGQDPARALWLAICNPLVIVHFIGGAHNDAWAVALGVAGIWVAIRFRGWWPVGAVLVGFAMAVKQPLGLMMVAVALIGVATGRGTPPAIAWRRVWRQALWRLPVGLAGTVVGFAIPTLASGWGLGWLYGSGAPFTAGSQAIAHTVAATLEMVTGMPMTRAVGLVSPFFLGIGVLMIAWLGWKYAASRPIAFVAWGLVAFAFTYPSLQPWYAMWGGVLLGGVVLTPGVRRWVMAATGCLLITSVLLDYAGFPIPVGQVIAVAAAWPLYRLAGSDRLTAPSP